MEYILTGREPAKALKYFEEIAAIPHGSYNEKTLSLYLMDFAKEHELWCYRDKKRNVYIKKPATKGYEHLPAVLLQGHMDMVCEKNSDTNHDFEIDPLKLYVENDILRARGTTLGADNAVAVTYMMEILSRDDLTHPALECLFTTEEEIGLGGAMEFEAEHFSAKYMINIDAGPEGAAIVSCAGGATVRIEREIVWEKAEGRYITIKVRGLLGGHSGASIHCERGNSNKIIARILHNVIKECPVNLIEIDGGSKDNAIPRECDVTIAIPTDKFDVVRDIVSKVTNKVMNELGSNDPGFNVIIEDKNRSFDKMMNKKTSTDLIEMIYLIPNGPRHMSRTMEGFVIASQNVGVVKTEENLVSVTVAPRSALDTLVQNAYDEVHTLAKMFGARAQNTSEYPGWPMEEVSPFRELCKEVYKEMSGEELKVSAIHGGLECGLIKNKMPEIDIIAIGPNSTGAHTPDESLDLKSFERTFNFVVGVLKAMCK